MPIIGLTHNSDLTPRVSRSITTKVAIGLAPKDEKDHPKRLDHFVFLQKGLRNGKPGWFPNEELTKHFGQSPREIWVTFLDNDVDTVFRTSYAAYVQRGCWCRGDGDKAERRGTTDEIKAGKWLDFVPFTGPCANDVNGKHCPFIDNRKCAPSGDLYFMLADFPALGSICRLHTSSYQSIRQIYSGLIDIKNVSGGRLMGLTAKLFVHPDKSIYEQDGKARSGVKHVLGIEVRAEDMRQLQTKMLDTAMVFQNIRGVLGTGTVEVIEDEEERGAELSEEFYHDAGEIIDGEVVAATERSGAAGRSAPADCNEPELLDKIHERLTAMGYNRAQRDAKIAQNRERLADFLKEIEASQQSGKKRSTVKAEPSDKAEGKTRKSEGNSQKSEGNSSAQESGDPLDDPKLFISQEEIHSEKPQPQPAAQAEQQGWSF